MYISDRITGIGKQISICKVLIVKVFFAAIQKVGSLNAFRKYLAPTHFPSKKPLPRVYSFTEITMPLIGR